MKTYNSREFANVLIKNGYEYLRCKGDHKIYTNGERKITFNWRSLNKMVARRLIKEYNLSEEVA